MRLIVRQAWRTAAVFTALYALAFCVSLLFFPLSSENSATLYAYRAIGSLYRTEPKYIVLNRAPLIGSESGVFVIGASNVALSFNPDELQPLMPEVRVHNLSLGGANVTELRQIVQLIKEVVPPSSFCGHTFVFGLWYGLFIDDATRWKGAPTDIEIEALRYGLYRRSGEAVEPRLPTAWFPYATLALRPLLALEVATKGSLQPLRKWLEGERTHTDLDTITPDQAAKEKVLREWSKKVGSRDGRLRDEQFDVLVEMVRALADCGARVVLVDLPMPEWHRIRSPFVRDYRQRLAQHLEAVSGLPTVRYHDFHARFPDAHFYDEVHPRPRVRNLWAAALATALKPTIDVRSGNIAATH
jgi:hypothetical protein